MARWHGPSCQHPSIELTADKWPRCTSCESLCPSLTELCLRQDGIGNSSLTVPTDERQGYMNLHWPPCVPYAQFYMDSDGRFDADSAVTPHNIATARRPVPTDPIYGTTLGGSEFRIACLTAPANDDEPIHLTLETYRDDCHPEYETVSYLWGGEDGDYSPSHPIFVGPFWDVLLQTKNCWSMFQFVRPLRGERLVWVDALCINQQNLEERTSQVAKMRQIYRQCSRVIAYLGSDLIARSMPLRLGSQIVAHSQPYPYFRPLYELHKANKSRDLFPPHHPRHSHFFGLKELLSRRYFTRVWIVQELLLPERAVFRIGNTEFRVDATIMSRITNHYLKSPMWWSGTAAPWVQHLAQREISSRNTFCPTFEVLRYVKNSHASDPRDRFFGVVSLVDDGQLKEWFAPDYSISYRHMCIGLFAHWIINQKAYGLLYKAKGLVRSTGDNPSWLPECNSTDAWNDILTPDSAKWPYHCTHDFLTFVEDRRPLNDRISLAAKEMMHLEPGAFKLCTLATTEQNDSWPVKPWHEGAYVVSSNGALGINLVHLFKFDQQPRLVQRGKTSQYTFIANDLGHSCLYVTSAFRLDRIIQPGCDHLFMIDGGEIDLTHVAFEERPNFIDNRVLFMILRLDKNNVTTPLQCRLLTADVFLFEVLRQDNLGDQRYRRCHAISNWTSKPVRGEDLGHGAVEATCSVAKAIVSIRKGLYKLMYSNVSAEDPNPCELGYTFGGWDDRDILAAEPDFPCFRCEWQRIFPRLTGRAEFCDAMLAMCRAMSGNDSLAQREKLHHVVLQLNTARESQGYLVIKVDYSSWDDNRSYTGIDWEWNWSAQFSGPQNWYPRYNTQWSEVLRIAPPGVDEVFVRAPVAVIIDRLVKDLEFFIHALGIVMESYTPHLSLQEAWELVKNGPTEDEKTIGVPKLFGGKKIDGSIYAVEIL